jgi:hypothetical protein
MHMRRRILCHIWLGQRPAAILLQDWAKSSRVRPAWPRYDTGMIRVYAGRQSDFALCVSYWE